ncbi:MAG: hypothetical protein ACU836_16500 [Gammaproteobacteria bacterium]
MLKKLVWLLFASLPLPALADEVFAQTLPECEARLEHRTVEPELLIVRSDCELSIRSLARLLDEGLEALFPHNHIAIHSIQLGRLMTYPDWSRTLAIEAAKSPDWDLRRGKPRNQTQHVNHWVTSMLNKSAYPKPLEAVFHRHDQIACVAVVEKVLVFEADDLIPVEQRRAKGIEAKARLPFDAQVWLTLQPTESVCHRR